MYEAHITFKNSDRELVQKNCPHGWKFSAIDGDPVLGKEVFCYLTSHGINGKKLLERARAEVVVYKACHGIDAVRTKVEHIVYDTKAGINLLDP